MKPTLHLLVGLPGSGKTTLATLLASIIGATRLSSDEYRLSMFKNPSFTQTEHDELYALLDHNVEHLLQKGQSVIYDANLNRLHHRKEKYDLASSLHAKVVLWWVQTPKTIAKQRRISEQNTMLVPEGETPENMFDRITHVFEEPQATENPILIDGTTITESLVREKLKQNSLI